MARRVVGDERRDAMRHNGDVTAEGGACGRRYGRLCAAERIGDDAGLEGGVWAVVEEGAVMGRPGGRHVQRVISEETRE